MATSLDLRVVPRRMTAAEFLDYPWGETQAELVRGEVRVTPFPTGAHNRIVRNLFLALHPHVATRSLGEVWGDNVGYALPHAPDTLRGPDVSFVRAGRLPEELPLRGLFPIAPDLAVEVLSPNDRYGDVIEKLDDFFAAGTTLAWIVDPVRRHVECVTPDGPRRIVREGDVLDGAPVLPDFTLPVVDVFAGVARER